MLMLCPKLEFKSRINRGFHEAEGSVLSDVVMKVVFIVCLSLLNSLNSHQLQSIHGVLLAGQSTQKM